MKPRYVLIGLAAFALGFVLTGSLHHAAKKPFVLAVNSAALPQVKPEAVSARLRDVTPIATNGLDVFFNSAGQPGILYIYRSDCEPCDTQARELKPMQSSMQFIAVSMDDSRAALAQKLAGETGQLGYIPYYVEPRRLLTVRTWLNDHGCSFDGSLPYVAVTDGHGRCAMVWEGVVAGSVVQTALNSLTNSHSVASSQLSDTP